MYYSKNKINGSIVTISSEIKGLNVNDNINIFTVNPNKLITYNFKNNIINECNYIEECQLIYIVNLLKSTVIKRIESSETPIALLHSGSLGSSIILCIAVQYLKSQNKDIHVFTMNYMNELGNTTSIYDFECNLLVELLDVKLTKLNFNINDIKDNIDNIIYQTESYDLNTVRTSIMNYIFAKKIKETTNYKVFLSGIGTDELFKGDLYYNPNIILSTQDTDESYKMKLYNLKYIHTINPNKEFDLLKANKCFNAFGLKIKFPFLDKEFIRYIKSIDGIFKPFYNDNEDNLLKMAYKNEYPILSISNIINKPKKKFQDYICDSLSQSYILALSKICMFNETHCYKTIYNKYYPNI